MKNRLLVGFMGLLCTMDLCSMMGKLSRGNSVPDGLDVLDNSSFSNLDSSSPGLTPTPISPNGLPSSQNAWAEMLKNSMSVSWDNSVMKNPVMKKPTKEEIDEVFKKLLQGDTQFKRDKRNLFQSFKEKSDHYDFAYRVYVYFNALNDSCVHSVKDFIKNNALNFEIQKPYVAWVAKGIAVKILLSDVKILAGTYLFDKLQSSNIKILDDVCVFQEVINLLTHAAPRSEIYSILTEFGYIADIESKNLLIEEIALTMVRTIRSQKNEPKDQTLVLQEEIRKKQLQRSESDRRKAEQEMAQRDAACRASREKQKAQLQNQL